MPLGDMRAIVVKYGTRLPSTCPAGNTTAELNGATQFVRVTAGDGNLTVTALASCHWPRKHRLRTARQLPPYWMPAGWSRWQACPAGTEAVETAVHSHSGREKCRAISLNHDASRCPASHRAGWHLSGTKSLMARSTTLSLDGPVPPGAQLSLTTAVTGSLDGPVPPGALLPRGLGDHGLPH